MNLIFRVFKFRSQMGLRKLFNNEIFPIYGTGRFGWRLVKIGGVLHLHQAHAQQLRTTQTMDQCTHRQYNETGLKQEAQLNT